MKCPICKTEVSDTDRSCPNCKFGNLRFEFLNSEEASIWLENEVIPFKEEYSKKKQWMLLLPSLNTFEQYMAALSVFCIEESADDSTLGSFIAAYSLDLQRQITTEHIKADIPSAQSIAKALHNNQKVIREFFIPSAEHGVTLSQVDQFIRKHIVDKTTTLSAWDIMLYASYISRNRRWVKADKKCSVFFVNTDYQNGLRRALLENTPNALTDTQIKIFLKRTHFDTKYGITEDDVRNDMFAAGIVEPLYLLQ